MIDIKRQVANLVFTAPEQRSARVGLLLRRVEATGQLQELNDELAANGYIVTVDATKSINVTTKESS